MQLTLNRSHCPVFVRHPLPWRIDVFPEVVLQSQGVLRDAAGNRITDAVRSSIQYHRIVSLYTFCVPGAVKFLYRDADLHSIHVMCAETPAVLRNHPLPWRIREQPYPAIRKWGGVYRGAAPAAGSSAAVSRWIADTDGYIIGNKWHTDSIADDEYMTLFELAKLAEDMLFRRDRGFRTGV